MNSVLKKLLQDNFSVLLNNSNLREIHLNETLKRSAPMEQTLVVRETPC